MMHTVRALFALGLFGWAGYAIWTEQLIGGSSRKSRALNDLAAYATDTWGREMTSVFLFSAGIILFFLFQIMGARASRERAYVD